jgi:hypothetical protein
MRGIFVTAAAIYKHFMQKWLLSPYAYTLIRATGKAC